MRTKKFLYNTSSAALYQALTLLVGLILPRLYITVYGSEVNGLVSSITQFISYFQYVELGIGPALIYALYKPLAEQNTVQISQIVTVAKKSYLKASGWYFLLVVGLSFLYPLLIKMEHIEFAEVVLLILVIGAFGVLDFYTLAKYRVLLTADQRYYIVTIASIVILILNFAITVMLINFKADIVIVKAVPLITFVVRSEILRLYVSKEYAYLQYDKVSGKTLSNNKSWDALLFQLSISISMSLPLIIVSIFCSLKLASVFSIYSLVFTGISGVLAIFTVGSSASFGNIIANGETATLKIINNQYEFSLYMINSFLFSAALILVIPFIQIYTKDISDVNYVNQVYGILFVVWSVLHNARLPQNALVNGAGLYEDTRKLSIWQIVLLGGLSVIFALVFKIIGVLAAMILTALYYSVSLMWIVKRILLKDSLFRSLNRLIRVFGVIILAYIPFITVIKINATTLQEWFVWAIKVSAWCGFVSIIINFSFDRKTFVEIFCRVSSLFLLKDRPNG